MHTIHVTNVNQGLARALRDLQTMGEVRSSRNGVVLAFPEAVATVYMHPDERVLFSPMRNANPCFHLVESLWMLSGRRDVKFPSTFVKNMRSFTDDGETYWGAYGYRWRNFFGFDQIEEAIKELKANPESRRVVIQMWNAELQVNDAVYKVNGPHADLLVGKAGGKDVPCNTSIYFDMRRGRLNMLVSCRSNDILWGCYGANAVHMSILQEYMALSIGVPVGTYTQMSNDLHLYHATTPKDGIIALADDSEKHDFYRKGIRPQPLWYSHEDKDMFDADISKFFEAFDMDGVTAIGSINYQTEFFNHTVKPMVKAWAYRKSALASENWAYKIGAPDWAYAMTHWLRAQAGAK